uniref:Uncharacterized protein n=1 Tax=Rhizophora mucronata TaxID=61149 RepID=A0A2P2NI14_RHIMU
MPFVLLCFSVLMWQKSAENLIPLVHRNLFKFKLMGMNF